MAAGAERTLKVETQGTVPQGVSVEIHRLLNDQNVPGGSTPDFVFIAGAGTQPKNMYMRIYDALYIRAVNSRTEPQSVTVRVTEELDLLINPPATTLSPGGTQTFTVSQRGSNIAPRVTWSVDEGTAGGGVTNAGVYTAPNQGGTYRVRAILEADRTKQVTALVTVSGPILSRTPTTAPATGAGGAWVLKDTVTKLQKTEDDQFNTHQVSGTGSAGNTRNDWRSRTDARRGTITSTHAISPAPPSRLVPGTNIEFKLSRTLNTGGENAGSGLAIYLYWEPGGGPDNSNSIWTPASETGSPNWSRVWDWKVPAKRSAKMLFIFAASGPGGSVETRYIYEWVE